MSDQVFAALIAGAVGIIGYLFGYRRIQYERFYARRDEVIAELTGLMYQVQDTYFHWSYVATPPTMSGEEAAQKHVEKGETAVGKLNDLIWYFYSNEAWLSPETAAVVEEFIEKVQEITQAHPPNLRDMRFTLTPEGQSRSQRIREEIPALRVSAVQHFKKVLHPRPLHETPLQILGWLEARNSKSAENFAGSDNGDNPRR